MPIKTTKKTSIKDKSGNSSVNKSVAEISESKSSSKSVKKDGSKKVVVKRRKLDLTPSRASAAAIASQANREKKQALIERVSMSEYVPSAKNSYTDTTKIPLWVWIFFGCSLLLFCISFYRAVIYPQLERGSVDNIGWVDSVTASDIEYSEVVVDSDNMDVEEKNIIQNADGDFGRKVPETSVELIEESFARLSNRDFDGFFDLLIPAMKSSSEIRDHFTAFRMEPFLNGIEGGRLVPQNIQYISSPSYGRDKYSFDISYIISSSQEKYDETWEVVVNTSGEEPKISRISCVTSKCSYHPIFWPENFGLLR